MVTTVIIHTFSTKYCNFTLLYLPLPPPHLFQNARDIQGGTNLLREASCAGSVFSDEIHMRLHSCDLLCRVPWSFASDTDKKKNYNGRALSTSGRTSCCQYQYFRDYLLPQVHFLSYKTADNKIKRFVCKQPPPPPPFPFVKALFTPGASAIYRLHHAPHPV